MNAAVLALANSGSYSVVTTHADGKVAIVFGDPAALLSLDPRELERIGYQGHLVGACPEPCAWKEPCASSVYLVKSSDNTCTWLESRSALGPAGELVVNTRPAPAAASRLTQTARLSMAGGYLGPIAHELNNIAQGVSSAAYLFRDNLERGQAQDKEDLDQLDETVGDLTTLAADLQSFAQIGLDPAESLDIRLVLTGAIRLLRIVGRLKIVDLHLQLADELPLVHWRRFELDFVLLALLGNAADAALVRRMPTVGISVEQVDDGFLQIEITDSGAGFEMQTCQALCRTSKPLHRHLGLGLPAVLAIVASRGGRLEKCEQAGGATCLRLVLPINSLS